jgi:hypothetical protein
METFDIQKACEAQRKYVTGKGYPHFAPLNGSCFNCSTNIYKQEVHGNYKSGYSVEKASSTLITGCPHCHYSYCE